MFGLLSGNKLIEITCLGKPQNHPIYDNALISKFKRKSEIVKHIGAIYARIG
jgi:hypothetical protein